MPYTDLADGYVSNLMLGGISFSPPATYYLALSSTEPTQASASSWNFTEPLASGGYARVAIPNNTSNFTAVSVEPPSGYQISNVNALVFPASTGAWSSGQNGLGWFGFFDAASVGSGSLWMYGNCASPYVVNGAGVVPTFSANQLLVSVS